MKTLFTKNGFAIDFSIHENTVSMSISSDYAYSERKSQLHVDPKDLTKRFEDYWNIVKRKTDQLQSLVVAFDPIDHYDDMVNVYTTPKLRIERYKRKAQLTHVEWGSVPKDWAIYLTARFTYCQKAEPFMKVLAPVVDALLNDEELKRIRKGFLAALKTKQHFSFYKD